MKVDYTPSALWKLFNNGYDWQASEYRNDWFIMERPFDTKKKALYKLRFEDVSKERLKQTKSVMSSPPIPIATPHPYDCGNGSKQRFLFNQTTDLQNLREYLKDIFKGEQQDNTKIEQIRDLVDYLYNSSVSKSSHIETNLINPYLETTRPRFLFGVSPDLVNIRLLELWAYLDDIFAEIPKGNNKKNQIHYLIDNLYYEHKNVLDNEKADKIHRYEYNQLIYTVIQNCIYALNEGKVDIVEQLNRSMKKSLEWNAPKQIIGSLFGVIYETGAIKGSKKDLARGLAVLFPNLSESTLLNNLKLSYNEKECKVNYSIDTVEKLNPFKSYLKDSIPKPK